jgi:hypothetical protein
VFLVEGKAMKTAVMILSGALVFSAPMLVPNAATASIIERACNASDRKAASRTLCRCIQSVANSELTRSDQRKAAKFFKDPHKAQETRQSDNRTLEAFWLRYKAFGNTAAARCS